MAHLRSSPQDALLVSACDKLHNLQSILLDLTEIGPTVFKRFKGGREGTLWYYGELVEFFGGKVPAPLHNAMLRDFGEIQRLAG